MGNGIKYRRLGATDLQFSELSFGTGDNAGLMVLGAPKERIEAVRRALELGINHFDTAADYGKGRAEAHLGQALGELGALDEVHITTKVEIWAEHLSDIAGSVERLGEECLRRLGVDRVDVLQIHNAPSESREFSGFDWPSLSVEEFLGPGGAVEGLTRLRDAGKVRYFGFNGEHADMESAMALLDSGAFHVVNTWYNLLNPTAGLARAPKGLRVSYDYTGLIEAAAERGVGTAIIRPLSGGALTRQAISQEPRHPLSGGALSRDPSRFQAEVRRARQLSFLANAGAQRTLAQAAYQFILQHPGVTTVIGGFSDGGQLAEAVGALTATRLDDGELDRVLAVWEAGFSESSN